MDETLFDNFERLWKKWEKACENHPSLQKRFQFVRPLLQGLGLEMGLTSAKKSFRLLLGMRLAAIGIETSKNTTGWIGPGMQQAMDQFACALEKVLAPVSRGEKELLHGVVSMTTLVVVWLASSALEAPPAWKRRLDPKTWEEIDRELHIYGLLFLAGTDVGRQLFQTTAEVLGKSEKQCQRAGLLGWTYTLALGMVTAQMNDPQVFERTFSVLHPQFSRAVERIKESFEDAWSPEERETPVGREWRSALHMFQLACEKGDATTMVHVRDTLLSLVEGETHSFREDLNDLREKMKKLTEIITLAVSGKDDVVTGIIQLA